MSWRVVVINSRSKLDLKLNYLVIRGAETTKIFLGEISTLIIESTAVSLTASLICELNKRKIKIIFCDEKRNPHSEIAPYYGSHDCSGKLKSQVKWSEDITNIIWMEIIKEKIWQQKEILKKYKLKQYLILEDYIKEVRLKDETNREGHAAKVYFNALFGMEFTRRDSSPINMGLNYGYSILLSAFNREIVSGGYSTELGIFHENMFNNFNLSSDFMEPFRPIVDNYVKSIEIEDLNHETKMGLINLLNIEVYIDGKKNYLNNAIKIYCKSIFDAINNKDSSIIKFYRNE